MHNDIYGSPTIYFKVPCLYHDSQVLCKWELYEVLVSILDFPPSYEPYVNFHPNLFHLTWTKHFTICCRFWSASHRHYLRWTLLLTRIFKERYRCIHSSATCMLSLSLMLDRNWSYFVGETDPFISYLLGPLFCFEWDGSFTPYP